LKSGDYTKLRLAPVQKWLAATGQRRRGTRICSAQCPKELGGFCAITQNPGRCAQWCIWEGNGRSDPKERKQQHIARISVMCPENKLGLFALGARTHVLLVSRSEYYSGGSNAHWHSDPSLHESTSTSKLAIVGAKSPLHQLQARTGVLSEIAW